jgi:beta-galactosidase
MDRRDFMKSATTLLVGATLHRSDFVQTAASENQARLVLPMNRGWRYNPSFVEGGHDLNCDDSRFERVAIPHTNISLPWHGFDDKSYEFISLYRRRFTLPAQARGQHVFVDFEGVMTASTVWINGHRLGEYKGGYTPFSFELTPHLNFDGENVLAVDVDSSERPDIPPFGNQIDYLTFGGIYREVSLRIVPGIYIENIFAQPKNASATTPRSMCSAFFSGSSLYSTLLLRWRPCCWMARTRSPRARSPSLRRTRRVSP